MTDGEIRALLIDLARARTAPATICPSEVARAVRPGGDWRTLMPQVHDAARRLAEEGRVTILQRGVEVGPALPRGAYRIRWRG